MELPPPTKSLIAQYQRELRQHPQHHLGRAKRLALYQSFGPGRFSRPACPPLRNYLEFLEEELAQASQADLIRGS